MGINVTVVYTEKMLKDFIQFSLFPSKQYKSLGVLCRTIGLLSFLAGVYLLIIMLFLTSEQNSHFSISLYLYFGLYLLFRTYYIPRKTFKRMQNSVGSITRYVFYETEFYDDTRSTQGTSSSQIKYSALQSAYETNEYIYLFVNAGTEFIVEKRGLPDGSAPELRSVLSKQVKKYVICDGTYDLNMP